MNKEYKIYLDNFDRNEKIDITRIIEVEKELKVKFPIDYVDFIQEFNGGEGFVGKEYFAFDHRGSEIKYIIIPSMLDYYDIIIQSTTLKEFFKRLYNGIKLENWLVNKGDK